MPNDERPNGVQRPDPPPSEVDKRGPQRYAARDDVEEASMESFPASDPPTWSSMRAGPPKTRNG